MHYAILVVGEDVYGVLSSFDENLEVENIISKEELIASEKRNLPIYEKNYKEYLEDPVRFKEKNKNNQNFIDFVVNETPKILNEWTDDDWHKKALSYYPSSDVNEDGSVTSYYNPNSLYDWFQIGGRWSGILKCKERAESCTSGERSWTLDGVEKKDGFADSAEKRDIDWDSEEMKDFTLYGFIDRNGILHQRQESMDREEDEKLLEEWRKKFKELLDDVRDDERITVVDCHI